MRKFLLTAVGFFIPLILLLMPPILVLKMSGEIYTDVDNLIVDKEKYLVGYAYNERNYRYLKWKEVISRKKMDVLALGSSRVLQFRENMFDSSFYNSGYTIRSISDFVPFLKSIPQAKYPSVLVIGLDQWMFNKNWDALEEKPPVKQRFDFVRSAPGKAFIEVWTDLIHKKYSFSEVFNDHYDPGVTRVGLNAVVNNTGFRNDGSMFYGGQIVKLTNGDSTAADFNYSDTYGRIKKGKERFEYGATVNDRALEELDRLLSFCKTNRIEVVAFIPPFADEINETLEHSGKYKYISEIYPGSLNIFQKYEFELWDMSHLGTYNSNDREVIDGFHGSEVTYTRMLISMIEKGSRLKHYTSLEKLKDDLHKKENTYTVYAY
jgi:hypothetical protein